MSDYKRVITSIVEIEPLFAVIEKFFASNRYAVVRNEFPEKIEFRKKGEFLRSSRYQHHIHPDSKFFLPEQSNRNKVELLISPVRGQLVVQKRFIA